MEEKLFAINLDEPLRKNPTVDQFLKTPYEGPIPEATMYRLLSLTQQAVQQELDRIGSGQKCLGLQLGYDLIDKTKSTSENEANICDKGCEIHYVDWGCQILHKAAQYQAELSTEDESILDDPKSNLVENFLSPDFVNKLVSRVGEELSPQMPSPVTDRKDIRFWLFGHASQTSEFSANRNIAFSSSDRRCCESRGRHRGPQGLCNGKRCVSERPPN